MSVSTAIAGIALLSSIAHGGTYDVTAGPAKTGANPGQTVIQKVSNHGTLPEDVRVSIDEIGHVNGACGFTHAAPLATPSANLIHLNPGTEYTLGVKVAPSGPAGYHAVTVAYTVGGTGAVKVTQGVATVIGVTYPGSPSGSQSRPCVAIAQTPKPSGINPAVPGGIAATVLAAGSALAFRARRRRRSRRAAQSA